MAQRRVAYVVEASIRRPGSSSKVVWQARHLASSRTEMLAKVLPEVRKLEPDPSIKYIAVFEGTVWSKSGLNTFLACRMHPAQYDVESGEWRRQR